jgi:diguanylate cyclase (GGDEF)-like protein/PAS domain S-box-containing protein
MAEAEAERQNEVIGLLLRDFEENASDVLWETDAQGHLVHASPRLLMMFGLPTDQRPNLPVLDLLQQMAPTDDRDGGARHIEQLRQHLASGQPFRDLAVAAQRRGRTRWWSLSAKPLHDAQGRLRGWRGVASDITQAQRANRQLSWLAHYDPLTRLANRHQLRQELQTLLRPGAQALRPFAVLCLDLDHFKTINDTLGHAVGDGLLQAVSERLRKATRRSDTVARLGGDEFAVVLREVASAEEAQTLTQRLLDALQAPCEIQGARVAVRTSIGIALAPAHGDSIDALLNNADLALYAAKSAGRGEFRLFEPHMAALTRRRMLVEQELRHALQRGELRLVFQPQVDLTRWQVTGFEALLRWQHPELGEVSPVEFVPVAEEAGLISSIGQWVLETACVEAAGWPAGLTVSVNVSAVQAMSQDLVQLAQAALQASGLPAPQLELEITESIFLNEAKATMQVLHGLRAAGLRVALDDFGTGYSSLAYLRRFPFDTLKVDRSFVREMMQRRDARAIVRMIASLGQTLNMRTVAEGVEDALQAAVLRDYGCHAVQGFLVARPLPAAEVHGFLADWSARQGEALPAAPPTAPMPL